MDSTPLARLFASFAGVGYRREKRTIAARMGLDRRQLGLGIKSDVQPPRGSRPPTGTRPRWRKRCGPAGATLA